MPWDRLAVRQLAVLQRVWRTYSLGVSCSLSGDRSTVFCDTAESRELRCTFSHGDGPHAYCLIRWDIFNGARHQLCSKWVHANDSHRTNSMHRVCVALGQHAYVQGDGLSESNLLRSHSFPLLPVYSSGSVNRCALLFNLVLTSWRLAAGARWEVRAPWAAAISVIEQCA